LSTIRDFTRTYLPPNYGPDEDYSREFNTDTLSDRFVAAYSFLGVGWYCFGIGSLLIATYVVARLPAEERMRAMTLGGIPAGVIRIFQTRSPIEQHYLFSASIAQAQGAREN